MDVDHDRHQHRLARGDPAVARTSPTPLGKRPQTLAEQLADRLIKATR